MVDLEHSNKIKDGQDIKIKDTILQYHTIKYQKYIRKHHHV